MSKSEDLFVTMWKYLSTTYLSFNILRKTFTLGAFFPFTSVKVEVSKQNEKIYYFICNNIICDTKQNQSLW